MKTTLTYADVLLVPRYSDVTSRKNVKLTCRIAGVPYKFPVIPANMKTIMGVEMAKAIVDAGGLAILHRFQTWEQQLEQWNRIPNALEQVAVSIGVQDRDYGDLVVLHKKGVRIFCIDVAHGDSSLVYDMVRRIREKFSTEELTLIVGNIVTADAARRLWSAGVDAVKVGIGGGSTCSTRIETGNGYPQLSALKEVYKARKRLSKLHRAQGKDRHFGIIADGGITSPGDCVKALVYADMVMAGNLFSGCNETPGEVQNHNGKAYKRYDGSSTYRTDNVEGVRSLVPSKGPALNVIKRLRDGIQSGCSYQGADSLDEFRRVAKFVRITNAGITESKPHDVSVLE